MKSKKQENIIVAPRKRYGGLASESREKVAILNNSNPSSESQSQYLYNSTTTTSWLNNTKSKNHSRRS
jgi:hypothetical protein